MTPELNRVYHGASEVVLRAWPENFVDAVVCDPPYELAFMGKAWDATGIAYSVPLWREVLRVMKPGAHLLAFGGTRTFHRMACAIEDAGFEIRDQVQWLYGQGFPKSLNVSMAIDKMDSTETRRERALRFTAWMRSTGITSTQINEATSTCMASHYLTEKEQPEVATSDMLDKLRPLLPAVPEWVEELVRWRTVESENFKKRRVVGKKMAMDPAKVRLGVPGRDADGKPLRGTKEISLTEAHTELGKKWEGWGTALKPANEPVCLARKPLEESTVADNVVKWGTGAINVAAGRVGFASDSDESESKDKNRHADFGSGARENKIYGEDQRERGEAGNYDAAGRWPANVLLDDYAAGMMDAQEPGASRFFYVAKPNGEERNEGLAGAEKKRAGIKNASWRGFSETDPYREVIRANFHPTVKPVALMAYLIKLVTPGGGIVLDPFGGSGTTGMAAAELGHPFLLIDKEADHVELAEKRIAPRLSQGRLF